MNVKGYLDAKIGLRQPDREMISGTSSKVGRGLFPASGDARKRLNPNPDFDTFPRFMKAMVDIPTLWGPAGLTAYFCTLQMIWIDAWRGWQSDGIKIDALVKSPKTVIPAQFAESA